MPDKLHEKINSLKNEVEQLPVDNDVTKKHINELINEIENLDDAAGENEDVIDKIKSAIDHFEAEHPRATAILNDIMVTLSNMGI